MGSDFCILICCFAFLKSCSICMSRMVLRNVFVCANKFSARPILLGELRLIKIQGLPEGPTLYSFHVLPDSLVSCVCLAWFPLTRSWQLGICHPKQKKSVLATRGSARHSTRRQQSGTFSCVLRDLLGPGHPLISPVIKMCIRHPRKKGRNRFQPVFKQKGEKKDK